ncbi:hypothetical protein DFH06DRAFT_1134654 [Mycena polygramma]|nr:hypothetical protein DFH06DRAFT_1134654 [Mycena polygramma]
MSSGLAWLRESSPWRLDKHPPPFPCYDVRSAIKLVSGRLEILRAKSHWLPQTQNLPAQFFVLFPEDINLAYSAIPDIASVSEPTRSEIWAAFADSIPVIWKILSGLAGAGLIVSLSMEEVPRDSTVNGPDAVEVKADGMIAGTEGKEKSTEV